MEGELSAAIHLSGASGSGSERGRYSEKPFSCVKCKQVLKTREVFLKKKKKFSEKQSQSNGKGIYPMKLRDSKQLQGKKKEKLEPCGTRQQPNEVFLAFFPTHGGQHSSSEEGHNNPISSRDPLSIRGPKRPAVGRLPGRWVTSREPL